MNPDHPPASTHTWRADRYAQNARFVAELGAPVLALLDPQPGERILDVGCGDGALTEQIAALGATVVGVDSAPDMIRAAQQRGLDVRLMDGQHLRFEQEFDAVFSNAALHWMRQPEAVLAGVRRALKPGGRFVAELGGFGNVAAITVALSAVLNRRGVDGVARIPWYFPTEQEYREHLESVGFTVASIHLIPRPTLLPTGMRGWLATFAEHFIKALPEEQQAAALEETITLLEPVLCDRRGNWMADYVRLRFSAHLPPAAP